VAKSISGEIPDIYMRADIPRAATAMAMQRAYNVFKKTHGNILKCIEELFVSVDELHVKNTILSADTHCVCANEDERYQEAHYCMVCLQLFPCHTMSWTKDGRLVCNQHFKDGYIPPGMAQRLAVEVSERARLCDRYLDTLSAEDRDDIKRVITTFLTPEGFNDLYSGYHTLIGGHPKRMNIDAVFSLWKSGERFFVHHADNVILTSDFLNRMKNTDIPIVLAIASEAVKATDTGAHSGKIEELELRFDHAFLIRSSIPYSKEQRIQLATKEDDARWQHLLKSMRSGEYDGVKRIGNFKITCTNHAATGRWDQDTIARLDKICREIERSPVYNPKKIKLPRGTTTSSETAGAPWLWQPQHMFDDYSWELLADLFEERFIRMDNTCDFTNDHGHECAETIFLTCVILFFSLDGGKDEILGLRMSILVRHPLRFSIGKALSVEPGSIMMTG
jgi:hypothetical protein